MVSQTTNISQGTQKKESITSLTNEMEEIILY